MFLHQNVFSVSKPKDAWKSKSALLVGLIMIIIGLMCIAGGRVLARDNAIKNFALYGKMQRRIYYTTLFVLVPMDYQPGYINADCRVACIWLIYVVMRESNFPQILKTWKTFCAKSLDGAAMLLLQMKYQSDHIRLTFSKTWISAKI